MSDPRASVFPMTTDDFAVTKKEAEPVRNQVVVAEVPKGSRLETLLLLYGPAKEKLKAAEEMESEIKKGILTELKDAYPDKTIKTYEIPAGPLRSAYTFGFQRTPYLPSEPIREFMNPVWEAWKKYKESWVLREKKPGGRK
jgi:hypothetical protein